MKGLIISDTHGRHVNLKAVLKAERPIDLVLHLGDAEGCEAYIEELAGCPLYIVSGNSDLFSTLPQERECEIGTHRIFMTHGHYYGVNTGMEDIRKEAEGRGCDVVLFGHTHRPLIAHGKRVVAVNPGSLSYPRQEGRRPSYVIMEMDANGGLSFSIHYLDEI